MRDRGPIDSTAEGCPACGASVEPEAETCRSCGTALDATREPAVGGVVEFGEVVHVHRCTMPEAMAIQAALGAERLRVLIADEQTKTMDPFVIGGNAWAVTLRAPVEDAERVRERIETVAAARAAQAGPPTSHWRIFTIVALLAIAVSAAGWLLIRAIGL